MTQDRRIYERPPTDRAPKIWVPKPGLPDANVVMGSTGASASYFAGANAAVREFVNIREIDAASGGGVAATAIVGQATLDDMEIQTEGAPYDKFPKRKIADYSKKKVGAGGVFINEELEFWQDDWNEYYGIPLWGDIKDPTTSSGYKMSVALVSFETKKSYPIMPDEYLDNPVRAQMLMADAMLHDTPWRRMKQWWFPEDLPEDLKGFVDEVRISSTIATSCRQYPVWTPVSPSTPSGKHGRLVKSAVQNKETGRITFTGDGGQLFNQPNRSTTGRVPDLPVINIREAIPGIPDRRIRWQDRQTNPETLTIRIPHSGFSANDFDKMGPAERRLSFFQGLVRTRLMLEKELEPYLERHAADLAKGVEYDVKRALHLTRGVLNLEFLEVAKGPRSFVLGI